MAGAFIIDHQVIEKWPQLLACSTNQAVPVSEVVLVSKEVGGCWQVFNIHGCFKPHYCHGLGLRMGAGNMHITMVTMVHGI